LVKLGKRRRKKGLFKIDLLGLSQLNFENISKRKKANMRKTTYNKNYITLGFEPGFTRQLAVAAKTAKGVKSKRPADIIFNNEVSTLKKKPKKTIKPRAKVKK
jgi:hypothetical protein